MYSAYLKKRLVKRPSFRSVFVVQKLKAPAAGRSCCPSCTVLSVNVYSSWRWRLSRVHHRDAFGLQSSLWMYLWAPDQTPHEGIVWLCIQIYLTQAASRPNGATRRTPRYRRWHCADSDDQDDRPITSRIAESMQVYLASPNQKQKLSSTIWLKGFVMFLVSCFFQSVCLDIFVLK